jgi:hypothetical protein
MYTVNTSEVQELLAVINPASFSAEQNTAWFLVENFHRFKVVLHVGLTASGTVDLDVEQATTDGGTPKNVTGKSMVQLAATDDNKVVTVDVRSEDLDVANSYKWCRVEVIPSGTSIFGATVWGVEPRYAPVSTALLHEAVA